MKEERLIAKVADFGLSKKFYVDIKTYEKRSRVFVPWRWMAIEFLLDHYFTLQSDIWSYGVLVWELLSFGKIPYGHQDYDEVSQKLESGYRLPCPKEVANISAWSPKIVYQEISEQCFNENPEKRATFSQIKGILSNHMTLEEIDNYKRIKQSYRSNSDNFVRISKLESRNLQS